MIFFLVIKRMVWAVLVFLFITFFTFAAISLAPGDYLTSQSLDPTLSRQTIEKMRLQYGLEKNVFERYGNWIKGLITGLDLGYSFSFKTDVKRIILPRLRNTLILSVFAIVFVWLMSLPLALIGLSSPNGFIDRILVFCSYILMSLPSFIIGLFLLLFAGATGLLPMSGIISADAMTMGIFARTQDILKHLVVPGLALSLPAAGSLFRIIRANCLETLNMPFSVAAKARGLRKDKVLLDYALPNAASPLIIIFGHQLSDILSGAAITEIVCGWPGMGSLTLLAVRSQDIPLVMATVSIGCLMLILGNLVSDILLLAIDPRIRQGYDA